MSLFIRSSFAHEDNEDAVEVELHAAVFITVRAASSPGLNLIFTPFEWAEFVRGVKAGEFDLPAGHGWPDEAIAIQQIQTTEVAS